MVFLYREWAHCGDQTTKSPQQQLSRWTTFVERWQKLRGTKSLVMGDCNYDYWSLGQHQLHLAPIRDLVMDKIISHGWFQLIKDNTRYQNNQKSCLDHIYTKTVSEITSIHNRNVHGYDHNMISVLIDLSKNYPHPTVTRFRDVEGIDIDDFAFMYYNSRLDEFHALTDVDEAARVLTHKITNVLNYLAPIKTRSLPKKTSAPWMTSSVKERILERSRLRSEAVRSNDHQAWLNFKRYRNKLKTDMVKIKKEWIAEQVHRKSHNQKAR